MKKLQQLCMATVFTLVLTGATFAGEINTPGVAQPSPTPASPSVTTVGEIPTGEGFGPCEVDVCGSLTDVAFDLLQIMLSAF